MPTLISLRDHNGTHNRIQLRQSGREQSQPMIRLRSFGRSSAHDAISLAMAEGAFEVYYQGQHDFETGCVVGVEALLRWRVKESGQLLLPRDFLKDAECAGLIGTLDEYVLAHSAKQFAQWKRSGVIPESAKLSVNFGHQEILDSRLPSKLADIVTMAGEHPASVLLEMRAISVDSVWERLMDGLVEAGFGVVIDNYGGCAFSSAMLNTLPVTSVKIDRDFLHAARLDRRRGIVLQNTLSLVRDLGGIPVLARAALADDLEQAEAVGMTCAQGWLFSEASSSVDIVSTFGSTVAPVRCIA